MFGELACQRMRRLVRRICRRQRAKRRMHRIAMLVAASVAMCAMRLHKRIRLLQNKPFFNLPVLFEHLHPVDVDLGLKSRCVEDDGADNGMLENPCPNMLAHTNQPPSKSLHSEESASEPAKFAELN